MSASQLSRPPESVMCKWLDDPCQFGRMRLDVQSGPMCRAFFARFEPLDKLLAPSLRQAVCARFVERGSMSGTVAAMATSHDLSHADLELAVQDCVCCAGHF